ncbi:anaerobic c4-dicarboxylate antiporter, Dcu family [Chthoniobacter flavus Ellin428]|uniref:Anaerobic c4-dicarboxylate antiporter, Dcu family n=1 Tax=Chthoniobacter flavus Ellin428 TaxID=497964 RepID=B4CX44_9BACT|nr:anaerobic C4-dicarboxylate transporter [Chthoniobacter flavus]EDY20842.1 anaerobic c4-dicarboxylate antiporter, Dcu family [Chthoniobacter flavus Ellin428]TCO85666.1 anaerobic C4-dicarboxylate transporter DcuA [Chthoniobacter flavus]
MDIKLILEFLVILGALAMGARAGGVGLGLWGAVGLLVLVLGFGIAPASIPGEVLLIVLTVIMAASAMEVAGGIDFLVRVAEKIIRSNPKQVTIVAPLVTYGFTFAAGTGHIVYPLLPVIYEVAYENGIRPERPMAVATIASQQAITASPVSAATAAMIGLLAAHHIGLVQILIICVPSTLLAVLISAFVQLHVGKELKDDPEYQRLLASGKLHPPGKTSGATPPPLKNGAKSSAFIFLAGVSLVVLAGIFPVLRTVDASSAKPTVLSMPIAIAIVMLAVAAVILTVTKAPVEEVPKCKTCQSGVTAIIGILGLAWLGDTFINANRETIIGGLSSMAKAAPWTFAIGLFLASMLLYSQAATTRALMPLGLSLGIPAPFLIGMFPAVNGYFFIPNYGTLIAAMQFDRTHTTHIGKYLLNHSFMLPGLVSTIGGVSIGLLIASFMPR